jgi:response regulator of citrate/malate metabolism
LYGVYLTDNNPYYLNLMRNAIHWQANGFDVIGCSADADAAIGEIAALKPCLIVYGTERAGMHSFMKSVRDTGANCYFIAITRYWSPEMMGDFFFAGGFDFLLKPLDVSMVDKSLKKLRDKLWEERLTI